MSQRSHVAKSGSRPIAACSAACAAPGTSAVRYPCFGKCLDRDGVPDRSGTQLPHRQVERSLVDDLAGADPPAQVAHHLVGDVDSSEAHRHRTEDRCDVAVSTTADVGDVACGGRPVRILGVDEGDAARRGRARRPRRYAPWCRYTAPGCTVECAAPASTVPMSDPVGCVDDRHRTHRRRHGCRRRAARDEVQYQPPGGAAALRGPPDRPARGTRRSGARHVCAGREHSTVAPAAAAVRRPHSTAGAPARRD